MREPDDWRLTNQANHLKGVVLHRRTYESKDGNDHDHCEFCWVKFMAADLDGLKQGYATPDNGRWICEACFEDFVDLFEWTVHR